MTQDQQAQLYSYVKNYLEGAMKPQMDSDFGRGYQQGLRSLKSLLESMEKQYNTSSG